MILNLKSGELSNRLTPFCCYIQDILPPNEEQIKRRALWIMFGDLGKCSLVLPYKEYIKKLLGKMELYPKPINIGREDLIIIEIGEKDLDGRELRIFCGGSLLAFNLSERVLKILGEFILDSWGN